MVDIHSHILAGLDDGPETLEQSKEMLRVAARSGTADIVATPHANPEFVYDPAVVERKIVELRAASDAGVRIHRGCDFHLYYENIQQALARPARYTINGKRYLLVEFSEGTILKSAGDVFGRMQAAGITPVITHPERHALLGRNPELIAQWVEAGCRVQVTAQSLFGRFGRRAQRAAEKLLRRGLVHFIASDAHDATDRPPALAEAYRHVATQYGARWAELLFVTNPRATLAGEMVAASLGERERVRKWWWQW